MTIIEFTIAIARSTWPILVVGVLGSSLALIDLWRHRQKDGYKLNNYKEPKKWQGQ